MPSSCSIVVAAEPRFNQTAARKVSDQLYVALQPLPNLDASDEEDADDDDDLFEPRRRDSGSGADANSPNALDAPDNSRVAIDDSLLTKWSEAGRPEQLRNRFVTGEFLFPPL